MKLRTADTIRGRPIRKKGNIRVTGIRRNWHTRAASGSFRGSVRGCTFHGRGSAAGAGSSIHSVLTRYGRLQTDTILKIMQEEALQDLEPEIAEALFSMDPAIQRKILSRAKDSAMKGVNLAALTREAQALYGSYHQTERKRKLAIRNQAAEMIRHFAANGRRNAKDKGSKGYDYGTMDADSDASGYDRTGAAATEGVMSGESTAGSDRWYSSSPAAKNRGGKEQGRQLIRFRRRLSEQIRRGIRQEVSARLSMKAAGQQYQKGEYQKAQEEAARELRGTTGGIGRSGRKLGTALFHQLERTFRALKGGSFIKAGLLAIPVLIVMILMNLIMAMVSFMPSMSEEEPAYGATAYEIVSYALEWVGVTRYIYGAGRDYETDWQDYADCSSFVHGVFSHFGIDTGSDTYSMEDDGTLIANASLDEAMPGDIIIFFAGRMTAGNSYHVGIYIGEGQMVHCTGSKSCVSPETAGPGVLVRDVYGGSYQVRRIITENSLGGIGTGGHRVDPTHYSQPQLETIWAVVAQEDNGSYEGALAVISCAMNRTESPSWSGLGSTAMQQLTAPGQFCYSLDSYWIPRLGGNVPAYVKQAVGDCLLRGIRNHSFTSFRSTKGKTTGNEAVQIGGNWFFGH